MPTPTLPYYHNIDLDLNELISARFYTLTTTARLALTLTINEKGLPVYDSTALALYIWNGTAWTSAAGGSGTVTSVSAGTGMSFTAITSSGPVSIDTTKVPYFASGFSTGFLKYNGSAWVFDNSTYLTSAVTSVGTGTGLTGGSITTTGTISLNTKLAPADSLTGNAGKFLRVNAGETAVEYATASSSGGIPHGTASGTDTYTVTITGATAYADGDAYLIRFAIGNTGTSTLNINSLGAIPLYRNNDGPLLGGDVIAGGEMICVYNSTLTIFQCIGVSPNLLIAYVTNDDSVTITKGQPVYAFSGTADRMTVKLAYNTGDSTSAQTVGLVLSTSIAANQKGLIMMQGLLDGLNIVKPVNGWADGSPVYLGTTAGSITPTKQYAPNHLVYLGFVTTASPGAAGRIYVRVQNGYELDELHNVQAQTPTLKDTLWYDNTVSPAQWKTASITTILGYTPIQLSSLSGITPISYNSTTGVISMTAITANSIIGNNTGSSATPLALTATQVTAMLNVFNSTLNGLVPLSGGGTTNFLRADGTWAAPSGGGSITRSVNSISSGTTAGNTANTDYTYIVTGNTTVTLPTAVSNSNEYTIVRTGTALVTIRTTSSQTIQGQLFLNINQQYVSFTLYSDGSNWLVK